jgi:hypothetical protein
VLAQPTLGRARHAEQQQRPVGRQRGDGDLDQSPAADVLRRDDEAVVEGAAQDVRGDRPGRQPPVGRPLARVDAGQFVQLLGVLVLGMGA